MKCGLQIKACRYAMFKLQNCVPTITISIQVDTSLDVMHAMYKYHKFVT